MKQTSFKGKEFESRKKFGGGLLKGNARIKRPLDSKRPLHLVLRSTKPCLRRPDIYRDVNLIIVNAAKRYGVRLYDLANVGNHIHMSVRVFNRRSWAKFIRVITGRIAQLVQGLTGQDSGEKFWLHKPFTRVIDGWGRAYKILKQYIYLNDMEGEGHIRRSNFRTGADLHRFLHAEDW